MSGFTFDAGGLIAAERAERKVVVLIARATELALPLTVPGTALAQVMRDPARQVRLVRLLRTTTTRVVALDRADATAVGRLLADSGTSDIVDAHVVLCARRARQPVVTSDPDDLRTIDSDLELVVV
ncbi:MAG: PIN domain-containing protein [Sporichthyaceae bacterium]